MEQSGLFISEVYRSEEVSLSDHSQDANYGRLGIAFGSRRHRSSSLRKDQKEPLIKSRSDKVSLFSSPPISFQAERQGFGLDGMQTEDRSPDSIAFKQAATI